MCRLGSSFQFYTIRATLVLATAISCCTIRLATCCAQERQDTVDVDFNRQIKPLLSDRCFLCHGPDAETRKAGLRLDLADGASAVIEAGEPDSSELIARIESNDDDQMPPADSNLSLTDEEKALLKRWVAEGATWEEHWSFVAPQKNAPPSVQDRAWPRNAIDNFVLAKLEQAELQPAVSATKEKLLRRVSFDLTGLPPTLAELDAFLADDSRDAYEKVVDRLLASDRFGERMASDWLDVARYSDTYGYQVDRDRFVWPWRDWVVQAFNRNLPYDQFLTEQIAGDLLPDASDEQILATTFNRLHPQKVEGGSVEEEFRVEYVADRAQTVGMAFLGLTVECARCHDHKYDPISQRDYYQLFAYFNSVDEAGLYSFFDPAAIPTPKMMLLSDQAKTKLGELRTAVADLEAALVGLREDPSAKARFVTWLEQGDPEQLVDLPEPTLTVDFTQQAIGNNKLVPLSGEVDRPKSAPKPKSADDEAAAEVASVIEAEAQAQPAAVRFTGDDEIRLDAGAFKRHQPFSIATRVKLPQDDAVLRRSVLFHRSRAWTDSASRGYQLLVEDGRFSASLIHFWPGDAISVRTVEKVPTEQWLDVVVAYDGSSRADGLKVYINGQAARLEHVKDNLQKSIVGSGTDHLILGARFRDSGFKGGELADFRLFDRRLSLPEIKRLASQTPANWGDVESISDHFFERYDDATIETRTRLIQARAELNKFLDQQQEIMVMRELAEPRPAFVLHRGAYDSPTDRVEPAPLEAFPNNAELPPNRLGLAAWMTAPNNPLTARVAVNHYWQLCFGQGLVRTPEDFGNQGEPPTHPQLLDWLAVDFRDSGWDVKRLLKLIVMSSTYRQSTACDAELLKRDPENRLLARAPTYRLPAEMIRDNLLYTSGLLVEKLGGPPVKPYELAESFQPSSPDKGEGLYRRSLYTYWKRTGPAPAMLTLDAAKRDVCQVKRERTSSPLAALVQLNNPQAVEAARKLAERLINAVATQPQGAAPDTEFEIGRRLFRTLTSRQPERAELEIVVQLFESQRKIFTNDAEAATAFLAIGESHSETDEPAKLAAWAAVASALFSFDECVMKR